MVTSPFSETASKTAGTSTQKGKSFGGSFGSAPQLLHRQAPNRPDPIILGGLAQVLEEYLSGPH